MIVIDPTPTATGSQDPAYRYSGWWPAVPAAAGFVAELARQSAPADLAQRAAATAADTSDAGEPSLLDTESFPRHDDMVDKSSLPQRLAIELQRFSVDFRQRCQAFGIAVVPAVGFDDCVVVDGMHPGWARIERLFADDDTLRRRFMRIASAGAEVRAWQLAAQSQCQYASLMASGDLKAVAVLVERTSATITQLSCRVTIGADGARAEVSGDGASVDPTAIAL
ncbi:hypothetical protein QU481_18210 [Crenobacter sp. SG2303]|uniref:Uncharacterized protein n=1 Tax=Crenobacter oryzisoli TaxID=3056844 RepID=A0ABT7XST1_9NEIS|nr:hypothetical protein [Crenobacter sp. SG2303]MDN0076790.1 hypothetical protein [Crenobacter sp. SG2303]